MTIKELDILFRQYLAPFFDERSFIYGGIDVDAYSFSKKDGKIDFILTGRVLKRANGLSVESPSALIRFNELEKSLNFILKKHGLDIGSYTFRYYNNSEVIVQQRKNISDIEIKSASDFEKLLEKFEEFCIEVIFVFFEKYSALEFLNEKINELPERELSWHFGGECIFKKMIIMKWANNPKYEEYAQMLLKRFEDAKELENGKYLPYLNVAKELYEKLKNSENPV